MSFVVLSNYLIVLFQHLFFLVYMKSVSKLVIIFLVFSSEL